MATKRSSSKRSSTKRKKTKTSKTKKQQPQELDTRRLLYYLILVLILMLISYLTERYKKHQQEIRDFEAITRPTDTTQLVAMFYNLENLFDTIDDPNNRYDDEFTPWGPKHWTAERYQRKLNNLSKVIVNANDKELPDLIGVCEIENKQVVLDLINKTRLEQAGYKVIHRESQDVRGIDLALIYNPAEFRPIEVKQVPIYYDEHRARTRPILYVKGILRNHDTLFVLINHWKSRLSRDEGNSEYKRIWAAKSLKKLVRSIKRKQPNAKILIMGDFNDEPTNKSLYKVLGAKEPEKKRAFLYNMMFPEDRRGEGTYIYKGKWLMFDNIIVSPSLLNPESSVHAKGYGHVLKLRFLLKRDRNGNLYPFRTYKGETYLGGYSDHLPVEIVLNVQYQHHRH